MQYLDTFMTLLLSLDDTYTLNSWGTGRFARSITDTLAADYLKYGVRHHQLKFNLTYRTYRKKVDCYC